MVTFTPLSQKSGIKPNKGRGDRFLENIINFKVKNIHFFSFHRYMAVRLPKRFLWVDSLPKNFSGANPAWVQKLPIDEITLNLHFTDFFLTLKSAKHLLSDQSQLDTKKYDALVVGAGHNGLIAGTYLAKQGKKVKFLQLKAARGGVTAVGGLIFSKAQKK